MSGQPGEIHLWLPGLYEFKGGLQTYCEQLLEALELNGDPSRLALFLKNTRERPEQLTHHNYKAVRCFGKLPNAIRTFAFSVSLLIHTALRRPDLIIVGHIHFARLARIAQSIFGCRFIVLTYGLEAWQLSSVEVNALSKATRVVTISSYTRDRLVSQMACSLDRVFLLPCAVDMQRFHLADKPDSLVRLFRLTKNTPVLLTVARLEGADRHKGYEQVLQSLVSLRQRISLLRYILVGDGPDFSRVRNLITLLGLEDVVSMAGYVPDEELPLYYQLCDLFVMPSKNEGFGIVYLEALACGKPVISGDSDGSGDVVISGETGLRVVADSTSEISDAIAEILNRDTCPVALQDPEGLRSFVAEHFSLEQFRDRVRELIDILTPS